ncbi:MAG TPA: sugar ABC transporter substrate-binding protein [Solirubrobacteraceae bacterium]|jgi:ribose transport system substrate-binding protein
MGFAASNTYTLGMYKGAQAAAAALGDVKLTFLDGNFSGPTQIVQLQDATTSKKFAGVIVGANDGVSIIPSVEQAIAAGIKIVQVETPIGKNSADVDSQIPGLTSAIGMQVIGAIPSIVAKVDQACANKNPCNVALMPGNRSLPFDALSVSTAVTAAKKYPNMKLVVTPDAGFDRQDGYTVMQDVLQSDPNVNVVFTVSAEAMLIGAQQAVQQAGKDGQVTMVGFGATTQGVQLIKSGQWYASYVFPPYAQGYLAVETMVKALEGKKVTLNQPLNCKLPVGCFVTKQSLAKDPSFTGQYSA